MSEHPANPVDLALTNAVSMRDKHGMIAFSMGEYKLVAQTR